MVGLGSEGDEGFCGVLGLSAMIQMIAL